MRTDQIQKHRIKRLAAAVEALGNKAELGRLLGYRDGSYVGQMLRGERPITEDTVAKLESCRPQFRGWFSVETDELDDPPPAIEVDMVSRFGSAEELRELAGMVHRIGARHRAAMSPDEFERFMTAGDELLRSAEQPAESRKHN